MDWAGASHSPDFCCVATMAGPGLGMFDSRCGTDLFDIGVFSVAAIVVRRASWIRWPSTLTPAIDCFDRIRLHCHQRATKMTNFVCDVRWEV